MSNSQAFETSFQYYLDHQEELKRKYPNQIIAIYMDKILGVYDSKIDAYLKVPREHDVEQGDFVIKECSDQEKNFVRVYHTSVEK